PRSFDEPQASPGAERAKNAARVFWWRFDIVGAMNHEHWHLDTSSGRDRAHVSTRNRPRCSVRTNARPTTPLSKNHGARSDAIVLRSENDSAATTATMRGS